jgi:hypothetical protein
VPYVIVSKGGGGKKDTYLCSAYVTSMFPFMFICKVFRLLLQLIRFFVFP